MSNRWNAEQVLALAPDPSSRKAAVSLAGPASWTGTGVADDLLWGLCAGSGKTPYQTVVDVAGPAYRCSCPSRKFPCKHALALLLGWAGGDVPEASEPADFAASWQASRTDRVARAAGPPRERDEKAAARRSAQRAGRVADGMAELDTWLRDQVRAGLSAGAGSAETVAARMVDAQAPGVAAALRRAARVPVSGEGWPGRLLAEYAQLHLLARAHARLDTLPDDLAATVRAHIGHAVPRESVLAAPAVTDWWHVLAVRDLTDGAVPARRVWLRGERTGRPALLLHFSVRGGYGGDPDAALRPGTALEADLHHYPGRPALRAVVGVRHGAPAAAPPPTVADVPALLAAWADALAADPWLGAWPAVVTGVPVATGDRWSFTDPGGRTVPLRTTGIDVWPLVAIAGGAPVTVAGEWSADGLLPLTGWYGERAVVL